MKQLKIYCLKVLGATIFLFLTTALFYPATSFASYGDLPSELPEDNHQYINLSANKYLPESWIKVYGDNNSTKQLEIDLVDRGVGVVAACRGYSINIVLFDGSAPIRTIGNISPTRGCTGEAGYSPYTVNIPSGSLRQTGVPGHAGVWEGTLRFALVNNDDSNKTPSFHAKITGGAASGRLGYKGNQGVTIYPSAEGSTASGTVPVALRPPRDHVIRAFFKAPCDTSPSRQRFSWTDFDRSRGPQPAGTPSVSFHEYTDGGTPSGNANSGNLVYEGSPDIIGDPTPGGISFDMRPGYKYELRINNVAGGNGINLTYPFDSGDFDLTCPPPPTFQWTLNNQTALNPGIGGYNPVSGDSTATKSNKAKAAYQQARFYHSVRNLPSSNTVAANGDHSSHIQYRLKRAASSIWGNSRNNDTGTGANDGWVVKTQADGSGTATSQSTNLSPNESFLVNDNGSGPNSTPRSPDLAYLLKACASHAGCESETTPRDPTLGDLYCERVWTSPPNNTGGGVITSNEICITLGDTDSTTTCLDWQVIGASTIQPVDDSNQIVGGPIGNSIPEAWVGDRYGFYYNFSKTGHASQTAAINFLHYRNGVNNGNESLQLGTWGQSHYAQVEPSDGGKTITDQMSYLPTRSADPYNCGTDGAETLSNFVTVPYYYHLKPTTSNIPDKTQQGDSMSPELTVNLPGQDNQGDLSGDAAPDNEYGGRQHTYSAPTDWRIMEFKTSDINSAKDRIPKHKPGGPGGGDCGEIGNLGIAGFSGCSHVASANNKIFTIGNESFSPYVRPAQLDPVGTNICYVGSVGRPTHNGSPAWRYSNVSCTTIVKSPKVQFINGDLTVGRHRLTDGDTPCADPLLNASIQTTGVSSGVSLLAPGPVNIYGSWVEYGAFATGNISGFGTAGFAKTSADNERKLMFGNDSSSPGNFNYGADCLSNPFDLVKEPDVNYIDAQASSLRLDEFFAGPPYNNSDADKTGYVANNAAGTNPKNITIVRPPAAGTSYTATVTIRAAAQGLNLGADKACPTMRVILRQGDGTPVSQNRDVCSTTPTDHALSFDLGSSLGYKGPQGVRVEFINDHKGSDGDRNLLLGNVTVKFDNNGSSSTANPAAADPAQTRRQYRSNLGNKCYTDPASIQGGMLLLAEDTSSSIGGDGWCYGYDLNKNDLGIAEITPPASGLSDSFAAFKGRDIVLYAKKGPAACGSANTGGNITIDSDINYAKTGYGDVSELPRIVLLADCKIIVNDDVRRIDAWLIAKDAVQTCSEATGVKFANRNVTQNDCKDQLVVNGPVQAKRLLLWRTHGADLTTGERAEAAEVFNLRPDQLLATYARGRDAGKPTTVYQTDLPPLY